MQIDPPRPSRKFRSGHGERLRRLNRYFNAALSVIRDTIRQSTCNLSPEDEARIVNMIRLRMDKGYEFPLLLNTNGRATKANHKTFSAWATGYAERLARLTQHVLAILPELEKSAASVLCVPPASQIMIGLSSGECRGACNSVLSRVDQYIGDVEDLESIRLWATAQVLTESNNVVHFHEWIKLHRGAICDGLRSVIGNCRDLCPGQPGSFQVEDVVDELSSTVWLWVRDHVSELLTPGAPLHIRLFFVAQWIARGWKTDQIRHPSQSIKVETFPEVESENEEEKDEEAEKEQQLFDEHDRMLDKIFGPYESEATEEYLEVDEVMEHVA